MLDWYHILIYYFLGTCDKDIPFFETSRVWNGCLKIFLFLIPFVSIHHATFIHKNDIDQIITQVHKGSFIPCYPLSISICLVVQF